MFSNMHIQDKMGMPRFSTWTAFKVEKNMPNNGDITRRNRVALLSLSPLLLQELMIAIIEKPFLPTANSLLSVIKNHFLMI